MFFRSSFLIVWVFLFMDNAHADRKVSCFYNSSAHWRKGPITKFTYDNLTSALPHCTHLIYGFVGIDEDTYEVKSLDPKLDTESGLNNFKNTVSMKSCSPDIKMLISVGGFQDPKPHSYFKVLETKNSRRVFINSLVSMVDKNGFDGADLAWQFPTYEEEESDSIHDTSVGFVKKHKMMFRYLVEELSAELERYKRILTLTILPLVKADEFIAFDMIKDCVEHVHLMTYDYKTPWRFPNVADHVAPLYYDKNHNENRNVEQTVNWWIKQNVPAEKLLIAIPTFGRSWKLPEKYVKIMRPPVKALGPGEPVGYLTEVGVLAYYDMCNFISASSTKKNNSVMMRKIIDKEHQFCSCAYRRHNEQFDGVWVSYDDIEIVAEKAKFANKLQLGGVAIVDLTLDDFRPICPYRFRRRVAFPILRTAKDYLNPLFYE